MRTPHWEICRPPAEISAALASAQEALEYLLAGCRRGRVLKSAVSVRPGDGVRVLFADGSLEAEVKSIHSN